MVTDRPIRGVAQGGVSAEVGTVCQAVGRPPRGGSGLRPSVWLERGGRLRCATAGHRGHRPAREGDVSPTDAGRQSARRSPSPASSRRSSRRRRGAGDGRRSARRWGRRRGLPAPIRWDGAVVGMLAVELARPLRAGDLERFRASPTTLGAAIAALGGPPAESAPSGCCATWRASPRSTTPSRSPRRSSTRHASSWALLRARRRDRRGGRRPRPPRPRPLGDRPRRDARRRRALAADDGTAAPRPGAEPPPRPRPTSAPSRTAARRRRTDARRRRARRQRPTPRRPPARGERAAGPSRSTTSSSSSCSPPTPRRACARPTSCARCASAPRPTR